MSDRAGVQARAEALERRARTLKAEIRAKKQELIDVKTEQAQLLGIRVITKRRTQGDHSNTQTPRSEANRTAA